MNLPHWLKCLFGRHKWRTRVDYKVTFKDRQTKQTGKKTWCKHCGKRK